MGAIARGKSFPEFYAENPGAARPKRMVCIAPVTYRGMARLQVDIDNLKHALNGAHAADVFMPAISPQAQRIGCATGITRLTRSICSRLRKRCARNTRR